MYEPHFIGKNGFIWWIGVIQDRMDPLGLGRCKVRIFGWHGDGSPEMDAKVPVQDLPWAQPIYPITSPASTTMHQLRVGDWVVGFFLDGESGQAPVMFGTFSAFNNVTTGVGTDTKIPPQFIST